MPEDRHQHVLNDGVIKLTGVKTKEKYAKRLRRVALWDDKNQQTIEVITNQMSWTANTITELFRARWEVEIFFRDIKQPLHIKSSIGTRQNAVIIQIWTALNNNTHPKSSKNTSKTHLVLIQFSSLYKVKPVCKS